MDKKIILLFSGGLDSTLTYLYLIKEYKYNPEDIFLIYFDKVSRYCKTELKNIKNIHKILAGQGFNSKLKILNSLKILSGYEEINAFVPYRNLLLAVFTHLEFYEMSKHYELEIVTAGMKDDRVSDKNEYFYSLMKEIIKTCTKDIKRVTFNSPVINLTKIDLIKKCRDNNWVNNFKELIESTFSCYESEEKECLNCSACFRKNVALYSVGIVRPFTNKELIEKYSKDVKEKTMDLTRLESTKKYIEEVLRRKIS